MTEAATQVGPGTRGRVVRHERTTSPCGQMIGRAHVPPCKCRLRRRVRSDHGALHPVRTPAPRRPPAPRLARRGRRRPRLAGRGAGRARLVRRPGQRDRGQLQGRLDRLGHPGGGAGDAGLQGYATNIGVPQGGTVQFKIDAARAYTIDIFHMGYTAGRARARWRARRPLRARGLTGPARSDAGTPYGRLQRLGRLGELGRSRHAVSGIYFAKLWRSKAAASATSCSSSDDNGSSNLLFQTSDTAWQAYNAYGGEACTTRRPAGHGPAPALCPHLRPALHHGGGRPRSWGSTRSTRWSAPSRPNSYDISYSTAWTRDRSQHPAAEHGTLPLRRARRVLVRRPARRRRSRTRPTASTWPSSRQRVFWKTRWEHTPPGRIYLIVYKETHANADHRPGAARGRARGATAVDQHTGGRAPGERADGHDLHRQLGHAQPAGPGGGGKLRLSPGAREPAAPRQRQDARRRYLTRLPVGRGPRQRCADRRA